MKCILNKVYSKGTNYCLSFSLCIVFIFELEYVKNTDLVHFVFTMFLLTFYHSVTASQKININVKIT